MKTAEDRLRQIREPGNLWSHSNLSRFLDCPHAWYARYILQIPDPPSRPLVQGTLCHTVLADAVHAGTPPEDWAGALTTARLQESYQALVPPEQDPLMARWLEAAWATRPRASEEWAEVSWLTPIATHPDQPRPHVQLAKAEEIFHSAVDYAWFKAQDVVRAAGVDAVYAKPDWVGRDGSMVTVMDWKSSAVGSRTTPLRVAERYRGQVTTYALSAMRHFGAVTVETRIGLLSAQITVPLTIDAAQQQAWAQTVARTIWSIKAAASQDPAVGFPKQVGPACRFCPVALWPNGCSEGAAFRHQQGWDRYDTQNAQERRAAGIQWAGDAPA